MAARLCCLCLAWLSAIASSLSNVANTQIHSLAGHSKLAETKVKVRLCAKHCKVLKSAKVFFGSLNSTNKRRRWGGKLDSTIFTAFSATVVFYLQWIITIEKKLWWAELGTADQCALCESLAGDDDKFAHRQTEPYHYRRRRAQLPASSENSVCACPLTTALSTMTYQADKRLENCQCTTDHRKQARSVSLDAKSSSGHWQYLHQGALAIQMAPNHYYCSKGTHTHTTVLNGSSWNRQFWIARKRVCTHTHTHTQFSSVMIWEIDLIWSCCRCCPCQRTVCPMPDDSYYCCNAILINSLGREKERKNRQNRFRVASQQHYDHSEPM